jgi:5-methylcytosine-specific restriction endonuclease McrA
MKKEFNLQSFLIGGLRRLTYKWPNRSKAMVNARIRRGFYRCAICGGEFKRNEIQIDHIRPVISIRYGFQGWDIFIERLFCDVDNLQVLCKADHASKGFLENKLRKQYKEEREKKT